MRTGYDLIAIAAERTPDHPALVDDRTDRVLTYSQLMAAADAVAAGLYARGVAQGHRVATALPSTLEHCLILIALQRIGAVPTLFNFRFTAAQMAAMAMEADARFLIVQSDPQLASTLSQAMPPGSTIVTVGESSLSHVDLGKWGGDVARLPPPCQPHPNDTAFIFYTSGTTGKPKGVLAVHRTTEYRITSISPVTGLRAGRQLRALGASPLFHAIGFYCVLMTTLAYGGTYYIMSSFDAGKALDLIERHRLTYLFTVPTILQAMISHPDYRPERAHSIELLLEGGSTISLPLLEHLCTKWRAHVQHLYGTTETYIPLCNPHPRGNPATLYPVFPHRVRLVKLDGTINNEAGIGERGELLIDAASDCIFSGYLNDLEAYASRVRGGWYRTGDVFTRRADNGFDYVGRVDDAIRCGGEFIYPAEIEDILTAHPAIREACVLGLPDPKWGEIVVACVVTNGPVTWQVLDQHCLASVTARFKRPRRYCFVQALPRNASNKILRHELRRALTENPLQLRSA